MTQPYYATPHDAETAFYEAFQRADIEAMMQVWADDESVVCIHPMGPRLSGREAVAASWEQIFAGATPMRFEITEVEYTQDEALSVHCVFENITHGLQLSQRSLVLATNVYKATDAGWRMILHHASPGAPPEEPEESEAQTLH